MDIPFIKLKPISQLTETLDPHGYIMIDKGNVEAEKIPTSVFFQIIGNVAKPISPSDATPTETGWYKPQTASASPGTNYPNAGNLKAIDGYDTLFFFSVTGWKKTEVKLPENKDVIKVLRSFIEPIDPNPAWDSMAFPSVETDNAYLNTSNGAIGSVYAKYGSIPSSALTNITKLRLSGNLSIFGSGVAWWIGVRADNSFSVLKSGALSSGIAEITVDPQFVSYKYSRLKGDTILENQPKVFLPVEEDSVFKAINAMGSGYAGYLDLTTKGLKESNTAAQNTTIINAAIEGEAGATQPKIIMFPPGHFKVNEIIMKPGTKLAGAGVLHTHLYTDVGSTARAIIMLPDGSISRGSIRDILIDATETTEGGIYINNTFDFQIDQCIVFSSKQYGIWIKGGLYHSISNVYFRGSNIQLKTTHLTANATNLISYHRLYFDQANKKCVELNAGSNYRFTSCNFENAGISGDDNTGGVHMIGLSPANEGVDATFENCWSEGIRGGFIYRFDSCKGNSVIRDCMLGNGGNGAGTISNAIINNGSNVELSGATRFSTGVFAAFPTNIRASGGSTLVSNPNINVGTNNIGTILRAKYS